MSVGCNKLGFILKTLQLEYVEEYKFAKDRKFKFDFFVPSLNLGIEYEGIYGGKSRHTTVSGYAKDAEKYNLATCLGYKVLRYTSGSTSNLITDLEKIALL